VLADGRRQRRAKVRHDAEHAPIDGDYDPLRLTNEDPEFDYFWASESDRARFGWRGWIEEKWGPSCARPRFYFGAKQTGAAVKFRELTLLKLPKALNAQQKAVDPNRRRHAQLMREVLRPSMPGHRMTFSQQTLQTEVE
jgi:hypothetical protein